jgi:hypothetical protein
MRVARLALWRLSSGRPAGESPERWTNFVVHQRRGILMANTADGAHHSAGRGADCCPAGPTTVRPNHEWNSLDGRKTFRSQQFERGAQSQVVVAFAIVVLVCSLRAVSRVHGHRGDSGGCCVVVSIMRRRPCNSRHRTRARAAAAPGKMRLAGVTTERRRGAVRPAGR